jgi:hypothetical protein
MQRAVFMKIEIVEEGKPKAVDKAVYNLGRLKLSRGGGRKIQAGGVSEYLRGVGVSIS